jgi:hypothetical protein
MSSPIFNNALTASVASSLGVNATFHVITGFVFNDLTEVASVSISSYLSQAAYLAGAGPVITNVFQTSNPAQYLAALNAGSGLFTAAYNYVATLAPFSS